MLRSSVSPDGWECFRWQSSPATGVVRHHLSGDACDGGEKGETQFHLISPPYTPLPLILYVTFPGFSTDLLLWCYLSGSHLLLFCVFLFCCHFSLRPIGWPYVLKPPSLTRGQAGFEFCLSNDANFVQYVRAKPFRDSRDCLHPPCLHLSLSLSLLYQLEPSSLSAS